MSQVRITVKGTFKVVGKTETETFFDSYLQGGNTFIDDGKNLDPVELDSNGMEKAFDGFDIGDYFKLNGTFEKVRESELFVKIIIFETVVSIPKNKVV